MVKLIASQPTPARAPETARLEPSGAALAARRHLRPRHTLTSMEIK
jgi:hypothetical protein